MKKLLAGLVLIGLTAFVTFLLVTRHLEQARADRLDHALMDAEARLVQLEGDLQGARQQLQDLKAQQETRLSESQTGAKSRNTTAAGANATSLSVSEQQGPTLSASSGARLSGDGAVGPEVLTSLSGPVLYSAAPGSLVRIEGTSTIHDWQVEGTIIGGNAELPFSFPLKGNARVISSNIEAKVTAFIPVRSLKSVEPNGKPYSDKMDEIMYAKLKAAEFNRIYFLLNSLTTTQQTVDNLGPISCLATGTLAVAGVTNVISLPVSLSMQDGKTQFSGSVRLKMTDFQITPPAPTGMGIQTGDEVTLKFSWLVRPSSRLANSK